MRAYARAPPPLRPPITSGRPHLLPCARHQRGVLGARGAGHVAVAASDPGRGTRRAVEGAPWPEYVHRRRAGGLKPKTREVDPGPPPLRLPAAQFADTLLAPSAPGLGHVPAAVIRDRVPYIMPAAALSLAGVSEDYRGPLAAAFVVFDGADACIERRLFEVCIDSRDVKPGTPTYLDHRVGVQGLRPLARLGGARMDASNRGKASYDAYDHVIFSFASVANASDAVARALPQGAGIIIGVQRLSPAPGAILSPYGWGRKYVLADNTRAFFGPFNSPPPAGSDRRMPTEQEGPFDAANHVLLGSPPDLFVRRDFWVGRTRFGAPTEAMRMCTSPILARFVAQVSYENAYVLDLLDLLHVEGPPRNRVTSMEPALTKIHAELPRLGARPDGGIESLCVVLSSPADVINDERNEMPANLVDNVDLVIRVGYLDAFTPPRGENPAGVGDLLSDYGITSDDLAQAARRFHYVVDIPAPSPGVKTYPDLKTTSVFRNIAPGSGVEVKHTITTGKACGQERTMYVRDALLVALLPDQTTQEWLVRMQLRGRRDRGTDEFSWHGDVDTEGLAADIGAGAAAWSGRAAFNKALAFLGVRVRGRTQFEPASGPGGPVSCYYSVAPGDGKTPVIYVRKANDAECALWKARPRKGFYLQPVPLEGYCALEAGDFR